ncbi:hypothetical protein [Nocardia asiatica]|uniref:hypothetical protein n=1 Tax=Nocardia asiatica TaxID=209252 RepID=UPI0024538AD9|nr:hypothetical protein [Nocardia asiatica]
MLSYRCRDVEIVIDPEDEVIELAETLFRLRPHVRVLCGTDADDEIQAITRYAQRILSTPGMTYAETGHGLLEISYPQRYRALPRKNPRLD